ncbi:MAG: response regulator transcription factor [Sphingobacteriaceae bacterium]|nr:response regulator transcription factor [Sphingobacteriaceae bacterium]
MITAIIIDDEKGGRETLEFILEKHFKGKVYVLGAGVSVKEGAELIKKHNPQLIFLDMEMPNEHGLNILKHFAEVNFEIIVTTAHKNYGIDAIKAGVFDYILKPIDIEELEQTISKLETKIEHKAEELLLKKMMTNVGVSPNHHKIPLLISNNKTLFVEANTILRCEADGNYTKVFFTSGKSELITKLIKDLEETLKDFDFYRVHKSHLINISHVKAFVKSDDVITMADDSIVPLSRTEKANFLKKMNI